MKYGQIRPFDVANGPGIRTTIFVTGCTHNCPGCFNKDYQDFSFGNEWSEKETDLVIKYLNNDVINGLTILGGEPFQNSVDLIKIVKKIKNYSKKNIWIYSGYTYEQILDDKNKKELLYLCDILVDGLFVEKLKDLRLYFRGSSNQRIINIKESKLKNKVILFMEN